MEVSFSHAPCKPRGRRSERGTPLSFEESNPQKLRPLLTAPATIARLTLSGESAPAPTKLLASELQSP